MLECISPELYKNELQLGRKEDCFCFTYRRPCPKVRVYGQEPYSPHLNIIEILWHELKCRWLKPEDYSCVQGLFYQVTLALMAVGCSLKINFTAFGLS